ncbi:FliA/WhiG family RNA polymerase sigma factor [Pseudobacteriovorax antillogorgiicola]|uniref:RNA polymerase sigma factor n=1 Tax=Pseudobacteriovorax antillogorgiicola TaxID=1513793 RepID=A0A1Y6CID1_9BACT|nr:FliA/WhiG family RNA polymerase sigma factor [Pseudobacteriovorax antillogorgiicola]TCS46653.1 RNA polymerase sigma-28 (SigD/FliA/WhiG) subunit [Pseudobacteriovorax antillogorgiicola]SMF66407.1 RNA polymerase sigma factor for flagellar operon FliA [Pseudobacteriovorax antillogorgiicola]
MKGLVKRYKQDTKGVDGKLRDQLIMDYAPLIRFVAQRIAARLPSNIDIDDLISAGVIGLMDAIEKYDPSRDNKFKTYAEFRIRGAILDELRSQDWVPRSVRDKAKKIEKTYAELEQKFGRAVSDQEISKALGVGLDEYYDMVAKVKAVTLLSIDELSGPNQQDKKSLLECLENVSSKNPFTQLKSKGVRELLIKNIEELPEKQKLVLSLYYYEDLNLKEIGKILEVTESRVSQLHTQAVEKLRSRLKPLLTD